MRDALEAVDLQVYAPRAGTLLDVPEAIAVFGLIFQVFGVPEHNHTEFKSWLDRVYEEGRKLMARDGFLKRFIEAKRRRGGV